MAAVWFQIVLGPVELVDEIDSTNAELLRRARDGAPAGIVLAAAHQTAGRGRLDRRWEAPPGASLLVSVLLRPTDLPVDRAHLLTTAAGLAAVDACARVAGVDLGLKWPNDVVAEVDGRTAKLAGLLAESVVEADGLVAVVVGMGLNVRWPQPPPDGGVTLEELAGRPVAVADVLAAWVEALDERLGLDPTALLAAYRDRSATLGRRVRLDTGTERVEGVASGIDDAGRIVVDGRAFAVGDVVHLRDVSPT